MPTKEYRLKVTLPNLQDAITRRSDALGVPMSVYIRQLVERDLALSPPEPPTNPPKIITHPNATETTGNA